MDPHGSPVGRGVQLYLQPLTRWRWPILGLALAAAAATYTYSAARPEEYSATATVYIEGGRLSGSTVVISLDDRTIENEARLLRSPSVAREATRILSRPSAAGSVLDGVTVQPERGSDFLEVTAVRDHPRDAAEVANALARAFVRTRRATLGRARQPDAGRPRRPVPANIVAPGRPRLVSPATPPSQPRTTKPARSAAFAGALTLALAIGAAFLIEGLRRRVRSPEEAESLSGSPVLGVLGAPRDSEDAHRLRDAVALAAGGTTPRRLLLAGPRAGDSSPDGGLALARAFVRGGMRVALVEANVREPALAGLLPVSTAPSLLEAVAGNHDVGEGLRPLEEGLSVITAGEAGQVGADFLTAERLTSALERLQDEADLVLVLGSPVLEGGAGLAALAACDSLLLTCRLGVTRASAVADAASFLAGVGPQKLIGTVVIDDPLPSSG
jgi:polysaccharide biosynthesis transport protein